MPAIECRALTKSYRRQQALRGVDLDVAPGELFGFLGPNGSGKSTTIRILLGLVRPSGGEARVLGEPAGSVAALRRTGVLLEQPEFYPWLTAAANIDLLLRARGVRPTPSLVGEALNLVSLGDAASQKVGTFSQGMRQRLGIAAAVVVPVDLLVLDEPMNGLDPAGQEQIRQLLGRLNAEGVTVFLSTHVLHDVESICTRAAVVTRGEIVACGPPESIGAAAPVQRVRLRFAADDEPRALRALASLAPERSEDGSFVVSGLPGRDISKLLAQFDVFAESITEATDSLERRFLSLTQGDPE